MKYWLRGIGVVSFCIGVFCLPFPIVSPKQATGLWAWAVASGNFLKISLIIMFVGALLFAFSFLIQTNDSDIGDAYISGNTNTAAKEALKTVGVNLFFS